MMVKALATTDISHLPELVSLAEDVRQTGEPRVLMQGGQQIAVLSPVGARQRTRRHSRRHSETANPNDWLLGLIGIAADAGSPDDPTDVSSNKHKYLADAYYAESHGPSTK